MTVGSRMFLGIGAFMTVIAAVYWFASYEDAGTALLVGAMLLALFSGAWLWLQERRAGTRPGDSAESDSAQSDSTEGDSTEGDSTDPGATRGGEPWFPHASIWPFWIGVASFLVVNGLIVGSWFLVPGAIVLVAGVVGYAAQSRSRATG